MRTSLWKWVGFFGILASFFVTSPTLAGNCLPTCKDPSKIPYISANVSDCDPNKLKANYEQSCQAQCRSSCGENCDTWSCEADKTALPCAYSANKAEVAAISKTYPQDPKEWDCEVADDLDLGTRCAKSSGCKGGAFCCADIPQEQGGDTGKCAWKCNVGSYPFSSETSCSKGNKDFTCLADCNGCSAQSGGCNLASITCEAPAKIVGTCKFKCKNEVLQRYSGSNCSSDKLVDSCAADCDSQCKADGGSCDTETLACTNLGEQPKEDGLTGCAAKSATSKEQKDIDSFEKLKSAYPDIKPNSWTCQTVKDAAVRAKSCATGGCPGDATNVCCIPGVSNKTPEKPATESGGGGGTTNPFSMGDCAASGNCQLDDIIKAGVNFAKYLFGLSGAIFLAIFIYGGLRYLMSGGGEDYKKAKDMMVKATIGIIIIFSANTAVRFIYASLVSPPTAKQTTCDKMYSRQGYLCRTLSGGDEAKQLGCLVDAKGGNKQLCGTDAKVYCCNIDPAAAVTTPTK